MAEPWTYKDGIYTLNNDDPKILKSQRKALIEHINDLSRTKGRSTEFFKEALINGESLRLGQKEKFKKGIANLVFRSNTGSKAAAAKKLANMTQPNQKVLDWMFNLNVVGWPKGKSREGFVQWAINNYTDVKKLGKLEELIDGIARDAGHAQSGGFSSKTGLAPQYRQHTTMGNQSLKGVLKKFKHLVKSATQDVRTKADLFEADVSFTPEQSFFDYMNEGPEGQAFRRGSTKHTWFTQDGWTPEQRMAVLFDRDFAPTADSGRLKVLQEQLNAAGRQDLAKAVRSSMDTNKAILSRIDAKGIYQAPTIAEQLTKAKAAATKGQSVVGNVLRSANQLTKPVRQLAGSPVGKAAGLGIGYLGIAQDVDASVLGRARGDYDELGEGSTSRWDSSYWRDRELAAKRLSGDAGLAALAPITPWGRAGAGLLSAGAGLDSMRSANMAQKLEDLELQAGPPKYVQANTESGNAEIKQGKKKWNIKDALKYWASQVK